MGCQIRRSTVQVSPEWSLGVRSRREIITRVSRGSMRRFGQSLGRDPISVHRQAVDKTARLDGVAELVLDQVRPTLLEREDVRQ